MGTPAVTHLNTVAVLVTAYLAVFLESSNGGMRAWIGTQIDVLPALMVYCGLSTGLVTLSLTAVLGGLWFDTLSFNPLGISVLPLFLIGLLVYQTRDLILRDQPYARVILGMAAGALAPFLTVLVLWGGGFRPLIGWGSLWQWAILAMTGGIFTPLCFWLFDSVNVAFAYRRPAESTFRPDREIKRGRV